MKIAEFVCSVEKNITPL